MKKILGMMIVGSVMMIAFAYQVVAQDANRQHYVQILGAQTVAATSVTGTAVDVSAYKGNARFLLATGASTINGYTGTVSVVHSTTSTGTYTTVTNLAGTAVSVTKTSTNSAAVDGVACDLSRVHKYVKAIAVIANDTNEVAVIMAAPMKSE
jgi:hypothetical protein